MKRLVISFLLLLLLAGCSIGGFAGKPVTLFDLGLLPASGHRTDVPAALPLSITETSAPAWLDSQNMFYRLAYANEYQPRAYAESRWSMPPALLFEERLKARITQAGGSVLPSSAGMSGIPALRIETEDFTQVFPYPAQSHAQVRVRVTVFDGRNLVSQKTFNAQWPAPTSDASGGAQALAHASDAIITDIIQWLSGFPVKK